MKLAVGCLGVFWLGIKWVFLLGYKAIVIVIRAFTTSGTVTDKDAEEHADLNFDERPAFDVAIPVVGDEQTDNIPAEAIEEAGHEVESLADYIAPDAILKRHADDHPDYSLPDALEDREDEDGDRA